jgi:hypothetical protein
MSPAESLCYTSESQALNPALMTLYEAPRVIGMAMYVYCYQYRACDYRISSEYRVSGYRRLSAEG